MKKTGKRNPPRAKIIPDSLFYNLWTLASGSTCYESFLASVLSQPPKGFKNFLSEYKISSELMMTILKNIFDLSRLSIKNIIDVSGKKKAELRDIFCIPIRTLEDWYYEKNKCPSYVRLMMLRHFHLLNLGDYIHLESELEHEHLRPRVYEKHEIEEKHNHEDQNHESDDYDALYHSFLSERNDEDRKRFADNRSKHDHGVSRSADALMSSLMKNNPRFFRSS